VAPAPHAASIRGRRVDSGELQVANVLVGESGGLVSAGGGEIQHV
jgi:hypothetical protein